MRCLILGGTGMLGRALTAEARRRGQAALALSREQADVTDAGRLRYWMESFRPELVVNAAAYTKVDACEGEGREQAFAVNGAAVGNIAAAAAAGGARLIHVSTDYVFDGKGTTPYREDDPTAPLSVYGQSKLEGERQALRYLDSKANALVVRTSWLFGPGGPNFAATMVHLIQQGRLPLRVVADQTGAPTYTPFLARAILDLAPVPVTGIVHYRNREPVTWHAFAREIAALWAAPAETVDVLPVTTAEFPRPAPRPAWSVLDVERFESLMGRRVEPWVWGLADYLARIRQGRP
ncbi:MAG TPA: dTDP-4-dehydrorhamnose reductase [Thermoanaerobaculia bacterium]|nr:dTDP-4-dehydrorhamnose reductase [Thermoanaerobaculia bacterium]